MEPVVAIRQTLTAISEQAALRGLQVLGGFNTAPADKLPPEIKSIALLGPSTEFWTVFTASHEYQGGLPDPMDRWSNRVIRRWAREIDAYAVFPSDGPPYPPFYQWAQQSGQAWKSPVTLLVGATMGLNVSFRGALGLRQPQNFTQASSPCASCDRPCTTSCPARALTQDGYDVPKCKAYLRDNPDSRCRTTGCQVRLSCPAASFQPTDQAQFHMAAFLR